MLTVAKLPAAKVVLATACEVAAEPLPLRVNVPPSRESAPVVLIFAVLLVV